MNRSLMLIFVILALAQLPPDWTHTARIADVDFWPDFTDEEIREGIDQAHQQGLSVMLAWLTSENIDIPQEDVDALEKAASYTHATYPDMHLIVYLAPLETVTEDVDENQDGSLDRGKTSLSSEHPEWLQVGLNNEKAVFYGDIEFWVGKRDEDAWCCPNDPVYAEKVKESVRRLAGTGIDGLWLDVVQFLCDYGKWENNWACHCEDCKEKFYRDTHLSMPDTVTWDYTWKTWVLWRQRCIEDFVQELSTEAKSVNPEIQIIVEHWHGFDSGSTRSGWSPVGLQRVTDCLAHEYVSASDNEETYTPINYVRDTALYTFYRGVDKGHASWILSYSVEEGGQRMLAASVLEAGCNFYDTNYPDMTDSVSVEERTRIFTWLDEYSSYYYGPLPVSGVSVYYSKSTIDFYDCPSGEDTHYKEFTGISMMLLSLHIPYRVVTDLDSLGDDVLILPNAACLSDKDIADIAHFIETGGYVVSTGETGYNDEMGVERIVPFENPHAHTERLLGNEYYEEVAPFFWEDEAGEQGTGEGVKAEFLQLLEGVPVEACATGDAVVLPFISGNTLIYRVITFAGIAPGDAVPTPQTVSFTFTRNILSAVVIPFLGEPSPVDVSTTATIPVRDHSLLVVEVEPVSIFCNEYDRPAAEELASFLQGRGIPAAFVNSPEVETSVLIVFGGHKARGTGEFVSSLLTDSEKGELEQRGSGRMFIFHRERLIVVIAGNEREDTARLAEEKRREIAQIV